MEPDSTRTPVEVPHPRRRKPYRPTLSDIRLDQSSLPPPPGPSSTPPDATEAERLWQAIAALDATTRAHAASYRADRLPQRLKAWATLVAALGGLVAAIASALGY